ncbi:protein translocase subunit SecD [Coralloluteibacterium stylophorae]|uniref:Protein translocase subunit SecD n=1 Tax=Coralloluteibacterium stylophorae TaxID=1776034 RepID=A0AAP2C9L2_9GAMM|nr:protein translocase subunit SecD [Coralloluteibacterium stylophorae]MBS7456189.1 protein translocase subunit SecD [Coralloluteibacterium stylophorae]
MLEFARWRYALVAIVIALSVFYAIPNLFPQDPAVQITAARGAPVSEAMVPRVRGALEEAGIGFESVAMEEGALLVRVGDLDGQARAAELLRSELGSDYSVALNLANTVPDWLDAIGAGPMPLGLDLQGGVHFLMEVDVDAGRERQLEAFAGNVRNALRDAGVEGAAVSHSGDTIAVRLQSEDARDAARSAIQSGLQQLQVTNAGDSALEVTIRPDELQQILDGAIQQNIATLGNRINELGVAEPLIQRQGANRIVVQLPGVQDTAAAKRILGATATLEYRAVAGSDADAQAAAAGGRVPPGAELFYRRGLEPGQRGAPVLLSRRVIASGDQLVSATSITDPQSGTPAVSVRLDSVGGDAMQAFTRENVGNGMGVVLTERIPEVRMVDGEEVRSTRVNEEVISVATIQGVFGSQFQTTGLDSPDEAANLALLLRAGSLAAPVDIVEERVIGPSLGQENIEAGARALLIGFVALCVLMVVYYRLFGLISVTALLVNLLLLTAVLSLMGATLTMPGIAGIVLTLGMAIDGNVLILERIRDELRVGNTPANSIRAGYERAWTVIFDSNVTKLISAIALIAMAVGAVRGFAVVLLVGTLTSVFTSVTVSRAIATLVYGHGRKLKSVSV